MKKFLVILTCAFSLVSCDRPPIPSGDFADISYEMFLVNFYVSKYPDVELSTDSLSVYGAVLEKYGYSPEDYRGTTEYYVSHPDKYARLYKSVQRRITARRKELELAVKTENEARASSVEGVVVEDVSSLVIPDLPVDFLRKLFP